LQVSNPSNIQAQKTVKQINTTKMITTTRIIKDAIIVLLLTLLGVSSTSGFIQHQRPVFGRISVPAATTSTSGGTSLSSSLLSAAPLSDDVVTGISLTTMIPNLLLSSSLDDPLVGSQVLYGMAHLALDFAPNMMSSVSKAILRLTAVVGRLFVISADYLPDQSIHTEELLIQLFLIGMALKDLMTTEKSSSSSSSS
jgi:hypothetical protein